MWKIKITYETGDSFSVQSGVEDYVGTLFESYEEAEIERERRERKY